MRTTLMIAVLALFSSRAVGVPLTIVEVNALDIDCVFDPACTITFTETTEELILPGGTGAGFLHSRTFVGQPGSPADSLFGYQYRIDLTDVAGIACIESFTIDFGTALSLDYDGDGDLERVFVVGGLGSVGPSSADKEANTITFHFPEPVCAGESSFFFGMASSRAPQLVTARVTELVTGDVVEVAAGGPPGPSSGFLPRPDLNDDLSAGQRATLAQLVQDYVTTDIIQEHLDPPAKHGVPLFLPWHREYLNGLENDLISRGHPEFVPLPKWDSAKPVPDEFDVIDEHCLGGPISCPALHNTTPNFPLPDELTFPQLCGNFDTLEELRLLPPGLEFWHGGVHNAVGGTMANCNSPGAIIFWEHHARVDDVWRSWLSCIGVVSIPLPPPPCPVPPCFPIWYGLDDPGLVDPDGLTVNDRRGFDNTGNLIGDPTPIPGLVGGALEFDGISDHIQVPDHPELDVGLFDLSIDVWLRTSSLGFQPIVEKRDAATVGYALFVLDGRLGFSLSDGLEAIDFIAPVRRPNLADGQWHHAAVTVDRDAIGRLYVDSTPVLEFVPTAVQGDVSNDADLLIARAIITLGTPAHFAGDLDEFDLFRGVLSEDDVDGIFTAGPGGKFGSLAGFDPVIPGPCLEDLREIIVNLEFVTGQNNNSLLVKIDKVLERLAQGNVSGAIHMLTALRNQAQGLANNGAYIRGPYETVANKADECLAELEGGSGPLPTGTISGGVTTDW